MAKKGESRAEANKAIRVQALRDQLANQGHVQHVIDMVGKIADLDNELESSDVLRLKTASELKLKLINKYLPDVRSVELTGDQDKPIEQFIQVEYVGSTE